MKKRTGYENLAFKESREILRINSSRRRVIFSLQNLAGRILLLLLLTTGIANNTFSQYIPVHPTSQVYDFLAEIAVPELSTAVKPYSRNQIAKVLNETDPGLLNPRLRKELEFYRKVYDPEMNRTKGMKMRSDLLFYSDSVFSIMVNPILGGMYHQNEKGGAWHWWNGAESWGTLGKFGFWGSLRDNHESEFLTQPDFMNQNYGGANFKPDMNGKVDYWEVRAGISYDFGSGHIAIMKDHFSWGTNYNGANILSGRAPSFPHINLGIEPCSWFEFNYIHAWLSSEVVDSTRSFLVSNAYGSDYREVYHSKFLAANLFTFKPAKGLDISFGNSIVYDYDNAHIAYFIPVMFYKAMDHHLNSGIDNMNSQIFIDISARLFGKLHLYSGLFLDEVAVKRITRPDEHNLYSFKIGGRVHDLLPHLYGGIEFTQSNALVFRHYVPTTTFESNRFNLGHYLEDNARELFFNLGYRPARNMDISVRYIHAEKGPDHTLLGTMPRSEIDALTPIVWKSDQLAFIFTWQIVKDLYLNIKYLNQSISGEEYYIKMWTPEYFSGKSNTFTFGLNLGF